VPDSPPKICPFLTLGRLQVMSTLKVLQPDPPGMVGAEIQVGFIPCQKGKCGLWSEGNEKCSLAALGDGLEMVRLTEKLEDVERGFFKAAAAMEKIAEGYEKKTGG